MLAVLLITERAMLAGTAAQRETARNRGVPWLAAAMVEALGSDTASSTLANLEERYLVMCLATGTGRGRRVSHVKLSAQAREIAEFWERHRQSKEQRGRWAGKIYKEIDQLIDEPPSKRLEIHDALSERIVEEYRARVARYSLGNNYQLAALNAVLDEEKRT